MDLDEAELQVRKYRQASTDPTLGSLPLLLPGHTASPPVRCLCSPSRRSTRGSMRSRCRGRNGISPVISAMEVRATELQPLSCYQLLAARQPARPPLVLSWHGASPRDRLQSW
jgi:hypothetical protein